MNVFRYYLIKLIIAAIAIITISSCNEKKKFEGYLYPIKENGLYGYIDSVGNRIIEPQFLWVSPFTNGLAVAVVDTIYREIPDSMAYEVGERDSVINLYRMYAKYGYIDKTGRFAIKPIFVTYVTMPEKGYRVNDMTDCRNALSRYTFHSKRALFCDTTTWKNGYVNKRGDIVIEPKYYYSDPFSEGLAVVRDAVAEPMYSNKVCITPSKLRCAYIDTIGNRVTEFKYESLTQFRSGRGIGDLKKINKETIDIADTTIIYETYNIPKYLINGYGEEIKELDYNYDYYGYSRNEISVACDGFFLRSFVGKEDISFYFINIDGDFLKPLNGLSEYQIDSLGNCNDIMEALPDDANISAATFFNEGFAGISPDKKHWFVIDKHLLIHGYGEESIFDAFKPFTNGLAAVKRNGKWGYINKKIKEQIPCKYDSCGMVYPYLEEIFEYDIQGNISKIGYINRNDSLIWESKIQHTGEIFNPYSSKEKSEWGQWMYKLNCFQDNIQIWNYVALGVVLLIIFLLWKCFSIRTAQGRTEVSQMLVESVIDEIRSLSDNPNDVDENDIRFYPSVGQYTDIIKLAASSPDEYFEKLSNFHPVLDEHGDPIMSNGNFAVVYKMVDENGKFHAVRCFHRYQEGRRQSYKLICEELGKVSSPYLLPIQYMENELYMDSVEYPVLLMDWVDGVTLDKYIRMIINDKAKLHSLANNFRQMAIWLLNQPFAHGDLKPDNILVKEDGSLVIVDYDGMYFPAMQGQKAREMGSPNFRDPSRTDTDFNKGIDEFPIITILLSLELLIDEKELLKEYGADDRLLFSEDDYRNIDKSKIFKIAYSSYNEDVTELADQLKKMICGTEKKVDICFLLKTKEKRNEAVEGNNKRLKAVHGILIIYNIMVPLLAFIYSKIIPSYDWDVLGVSAITLCSAIVLYFIIGTIDLTRPYKRYHLYIDDDYSSIGCVFSLFSLYVPIVGLLSPNYKEVWYITLLIIVIWFIYYMVLGAIMSGNFELLSNIFKTNEEIIIEEEENKRELVRSELRKVKYLEQKKLKEIEEQKRRSRHFDDLPF